MWLRLFNRFSQKALFVFLFLCVQASAPTNSLGNAASDVDRSRNATDQIGLWLQGNSLVKQGKYDAAIKVYQSALDSRFIYAETYKALPLMGILKVHKLLGDFDSAYQELQWFLVVNPKKETYRNEKLILEALKKAKQSQSQNPVHECISTLRNTYRKQLPPEGYNTFSASVASQIIQLYDYIGDQEGGIAFCDEILKYWEKKSGQDLYKPGNKNQYFLIRQAFEQDKAEGFKGCVDAKPGDVCMGRATKALIQSDYFPW